MVAKNPCLYPGDVRILIARDIPQLYHLQQCIVFSSKGHRPQPDELSGSDLDGDRYFVCWEPSLIPQMTEEPLTYDPGNLSCHITL